ncbi:hypothetical protein GCM10008119_06790 [Pedobacter mendelii]|uniref:histidine kinase n=1 Tax=Pedobacter mendelii TaxID=1908240 RepID=A0ABQ2BH48_9SPHI|nr:hypothetical protein GCM10008119_06790 [Pedobacter mendelii]
MFVSCKKITTRQRVQTLSENYTQAWVYRDSGKLDSAYISLSKAKDEFLGRKDSIGVAKSLINMAEIAYLKGDYFGSQELATQVDSYLDSTKKVERELLSSNYNTLGNVSNGLERYEEGNTFFKKAILYTKNTAALNLYYNNIGVDLLYLKRYGEAISYFSKSAGDESSSTSAMKLSNIAKAKWQQNPDFNPAPLFQKALSIRLSDNNLWGQNSSFAHLADYYMKKHPDSALLYAQKMYHIAQTLVSPDDQLEALQKLIKLSPQKEARQYFEIYQNLSDSVQTARSAAKNQFALIRYETEKNKADFLKAQAENIKKQSSILIRNIGIGVLIVFSTASYLWYRRRQKILRQEKEIEVKNTEIKYVKKVHDHVANRIYQVMNEIDNRPQMDKDEVAEKLDVIYHISRDLSYESIDTKYKQGFAKALSKMFSSYQSAKVNIVVNGNEEKIWETVQETAKEEVFTILQELMTNMKKHSEADVVQLAFQHEQQRITVLYSDNGKGIQHFSPGNGLKNTETRIKSISGIITFDTKANEGLNVKFSFPI